MFSVQCMFKMFFFSFFFFSYCGSILSKENQKLLSLHFSLLHCTHHALSISQHTEFHIHKMANWTESNENSEGDRVKKNMKKKNISHGTVKHCLNDQNYFSAYSSGLVFGVQMKCGLLCIFVYWWLMVLFMDMNDDEGKKIKYIFCLFCAEKVVTHFTRTAVVGFFFLFAFNSHRRFN